MKINYNCRHSTYEENTSPKKFIFTAEAISLLLKNTKDVTVKDCYGNTILHAFLVSAEIFARQQALLDIFEDLVVTTKQVNTPNIYGDTPIFTVTPTKLNFFSCLVTSFPDQRCKFVFEYFSTHGRHLK